MLEHDIKEAVELAFQRKEPVILAEEIAVTLRRRLVAAVQREIDSRFTKRGRLKKKYRSDHADAVSPRSDQTQRRGAR